VYWKVYVNLRSKQNPLIRKQKTVSDIETQAAARRIEKQVVAELSTELALEQNQAVSWEKVIDRWERDAKAGVLRRYDPNTITDTVAGLRKWTVEWLQNPAENLTRANGRDIQKYMESLGLSCKGQQKIRSMVNTVFNYGLEEKLISKPIPSPMAGLVFNNMSEKVPEILTLTEIKTFLEAARDIESPWYPIWAMALLTGMRNGELYALEWVDVDFENSLIRVSKSYDSRTDTVKSTKGGYWRNIPISGQLHLLLLELKSHLKSLEDVEHRNYVLPHLGYWNKGQQARVLRAFLKGIGVKPVKFHALRACFATQLLAKNIPTAVVMKICGWKNLKTMEFYVRLAGISEAGATEVLNILPSDKEVMDNVVTLFSK
jgi:integrase